jgi:cell division protein ZapB
MKRRTTTLTVAGAAQAWWLQPRTCFPFTLGGGTPRRHLKARIIAIAGALATNAPAPTGPIDRPHGAPYSPAMHAELDTLEAKIRQVADLCHTLRRENIALRQQLLAAQQDNKQLTTRLDAARTRLHALLDTLPEDV